MQNSKWKTLRAIVEVKVPENYPLNETSFAHELDATLRGAQEIPIHPFNKLPSRVRAFSYSHKKRWL